MPALTKMGFGPVGAFSVDIGPETPTYYLLIPGNSVEALVTADLHLAEDAEFQKAAAPFWNAPASSATKAKRIFQMRTYESPTHQDHVRKVEMFHKGEFEIFKAAGLTSVFYGDTLIGPRMPSLTYMLSLEGVEELNAKWAAFQSNPDWKKLSADPRYAFEPTVSNITNLILSPLKSSQI